MFPVMEYIKSVSSLCKLIFIPYGHEWKPVAALEEGKTHSDLIHDDMFWKMVDSNVRYL